jgi:2-dehydro-3-deoxyphosphooctonate aldolase (KDO 8-P synthase)
MQQMVGSEMPWGDGTRGFKIGSVAVGGGLPLVLIAGPCVIESKELVFEVAAGLKEITEKDGVPWIFKSSYDKANRTSLGSFRGPGLKKGLEILARVKEEFAVPVLSDVHCRTEVQPAAQVLDVIQIPAFLCRQTDLLVTASRTGLPINIKKGQFLSPWDMRPVVEKVRSTGNDRILLTERGTTFGYNNLVADMRSLVYLRGLGCPVVFDATHSLQLPGGLGVASGGQREFVPYLSRAAVACGVDALFVEVHPEPDRAKCDGPNSLSLVTLEKMLKELKEIDVIVKGRGTPSRC